MLFAVILKSELTYNVEADRVELDNAADLFVFTRGDQVVAYANMAEVQIVAECSVPTPDRVSEFDAVPS